MTTVGDVEPLRALMRLVVVCLLAILEEISLAQASWLRPRQTVAWPGCRKGSFGLGLDRGDVAMAEQMLGVGSFTAST